MSAKECHVAAFEQVQAFHHPISYMYIFFNLRTIKLFSFDKYDCEGNMLKYLLDVRQERISEKQEDTCLKLVPI